MTEKTTLTKLNNQNYQIWKFKMEMYLTDKGLWEAISTAKPLESEAVTAAERLAIDAWEKIDRSARSKIALLVEDDQLIHIRNETSANGMWLALQKVHERSNLNSKLFLYRKLYKMRFDKSVNMHDHICAMLELVNRIRGIGEELKDASIVAMLLCSLPDEYESLITALEGRPDAELTLDYVKGKLIEAYDRRKENCIDQENNEIALKSNRYAAVGSTSKEKYSNGHNVRYKEIRKCYFCGKSNHIKKDCFKWKATQHKGNQKANFATKTVQNVDAYNYCFSTEFRSYSDEWLIDSGATSHMTNKREFFEYIDETKENKVCIANGDFIEAVGVGHGYLNCSTSKGDEIIKLENVLYVPKLDGNLLSVPVLTNMGYKVNFFEKKCRIMKNNSIIAEANRDTYLYKLNCAQVAKEVVHKHDNCIHVWHRRLGHRDVEAIRKLKADNLVEGMKINNCEEKMKCETCIMEKMTKEPFPKASNNRASEVGELIHSDICGPMSKVTPSGNRYLMTLIDDKTRYLTIYLLKSKDEASQKMQEYIALLKNNFGRPPKIIRSDRGGEYLDSQLKNYLKRQGIHHQLTVSFSPEQNGVSERRNRYLVEMGKCMLNDATLDLKYWGEAVMTACYLQNRLPSKSCPVTPYEMWSGKKPKMEHIRIFGSKVFSYIPQQKRRKLESRAEVGIFVGYCDQSKGYRILDPKTDTIKISRTVTFIEDDKNKVYNPLGDYEEEFEIVDGTNELEISSDDDEDSNKEDLIDEEAIIDDKLTPPKQMMQKRKSNRSNIGVPPERYTSTYKASVEPILEPTSWKDINSLDDREKQKWQTAAKEEIESLKKKKVWKLTELPKGKQAIDCKWVFKHKQNENGKVERYKARLVAKGYTQKPGEDFEETYAPVAACTTLRTLLTIAASKKLIVKHYDVDTAFLNGEIKEDLYMKQPEGFEEPGKEGLVCKLQKGIYGLKQSAKAWNDKINKVLADNDYKRSKADPCLYSKGENEILSYLLLYVDDIIVCVPNDKEEAKVKNMLNDAFEIKDLGQVTHYLGIQIERKEDGFEIYQSTKIKQILRRFGMEDAKTANTPIDPGYIKSTTDEEPLRNNFLYREAVGALLYISTTTRPDISAAVGILCRKVNLPTNADWLAIKRVLRYLKGTVNYKLKLGSCEKLELQGFVDADWGGDLKDRKSTSGFLFQVGNSAVSWASKKQTIVALSSTEAEYVAASNACRELVWLRQLLEDLEIKITLPTRLYEDNQGCIQMIKSEKINQRSKHIDVKFHHIRNLQEQGILEMCYCPTEKQVADLFTKPLGKVRFQELCAELNLV